ncbi:beta-ketoacyl synthase N-terminal-like domain-containing protein [Archangium lansingense]|uniref:Beta-ketoacyl synthase N-terminal-like domain-containing protein n=1 Tax=Archangium lansingense TaxID=2995310 RepID=A0ABT3ZUI1_9BACT|nr:beta-ketoacyl synthase N-terminal-like domain-containing protein [Archangium lansinium]MCY1072971.1 beta-ketoacyl synthase N-terminal-like domain-containing protein [Archangium lansinium]
MSTWPEEVAVLGLGLCTPLGLTARTTQVEMAAGTVRFFLTEVLDRKGEPLRASRLTLLEPHRTRSERMGALATTALHDCLKEARVEKTEPLPLVLALPTPGSGPAVDEESLLRALAEVAAPARLQVRPEGLCRDGRAGFFVALARAMELLLSGHARRVVVGAVDSLCDPGSLEHLLARRRLLCSSAREGILPGEGAGFVLLARASAPRRDGPRAQGRIHALALAKEPRHRLQTEPSLAEGLTSVFRQLHAHPAAGSRRVAHVLSCQTGEAYWGHEFNRAYLRNAALMPEPLVGHLVAESQGDVGAGAGAIQLGHALHVLGELDPEHEQALRALVYGCSDEGRVGAFIISRET